MTGVDKDLATLREFLTAVEPTGNVELIYTSALPRVVPVRAALARVEAELSRLREQITELLQQESFMERKMAAQRAEIVARATQAEADRDAIGAAFGEPCAECGHIDWRSDGYLASHMEAAEDENARLREERDAAKRELRDFEHVEGEPLYETAAVAATSFNFAKHRAEAAEERCARLQQALEPYFGRDGTLHPPLDIRSIESLREIDDKIREALAGPDTPAPKARRESTYTVSWERRDYPEYGHLSCSGLTGRVAFARLIGAVKNSGPVVIHKIEREEGE